MTDPVPVPSTFTSSSGDTGPMELREPAPPRRAGEPAPPGTFEGRAHAFREDQALHRSVRRERVGQLIVIAIIVLGVYALVVSRPFNPASNSGGNTPGPPITVALGSPVVRQITCGNGATAYAEKVLWANASAAIVAGDVTPRVYELFDGDLVPDSGVVANATSSNPCAGAPPPASTPAWYVVYSAPNGTIQLTYTVDQGWLSVTLGAWNIPIENGSALTVVTAGSIANHGFGLAVVGFVSDSQIKGSVPL